MMFFTHVLFGILLGYFASVFLGFGSSALFIAVAAAASALPDMDHLSSKMGRKLPPFSVIIHFLFSHRGFMHSLLAPLLLYFIISRLSQLIAAAVFAGYVSHLLLDATTTAGIKPLYPLQFKVKGIIRTNSFLEKIVALILLIAVVAALSGALRS